MGDSALRDPGPMARFAEMVAEPDCMGVIVQRLTDAEEPETLEEIARSRKVPYGRLSAWITESRDRTEQYLNAMKVRGEQLAHQTVRIADQVGITKGEQGKAKLRIDTRLKMAGHLAPDRFGAAQNVNVKVTDSRTPTERDALVLEAARGVAFMLHRASKLKDAQEAARGPALLEKDVTPQKGPI